MAELVRRAVDHLLRDEGASAEDARKRALAVVGPFHSGLPDLAREHDRYLEEDLSDLADRVC